MGLTESCYYQSSGLDLRSSKKKKAAQKPAKTWPIIGEVYECSSPALSEPFRGRIVKVNTNSAMVTIVTNSAADDEKIRVDFAEKIVVALKNITEISEG